jgi:hypothetical protein
MGGPNNRYNISIHKAVDTGIDFEFERKSYRPLSFADGSAKTQKSAASPVQLIELKDTPKQPTQEQSNTAVIVAILMLVICSISYMAIKMVQRKRR